MLAQVRYEKEYALVLCERGHLIECIKFDKMFAGSWAEARLGSRHEGDLYDRQAAKCQGYGHPEKVA